jgi:hypothetical protein
LAAFDHTTACSLADFRGPREGARARRLAATTLVEGDLARVPLGVEPQRARCARLEGGQPRGERGEDRGLAAAVLGEEQGEVVFERQLEALEAPELLDGEFLEAKGHVALLGGPSGEM